jgi:hypothetical protein
MGKLLVFFLHCQEQGGQDCAFEFRDGLANYKTHYDLSWCMPLLGGNSPMSNCLILKMNKGYNGLSRELEKFTWRRGKWISYIPT